MITKQIEYKCIYQNPTPKYAGPKLQNLKDMYFYFWNTFYGFGVPITLYVTYYFSAILYSIMKGFGYDLIDWLYYYNI